MPTRPPRRPGSGKAEADCYSPCCRDVRHRALQRPRRFWKSYQEVIPIGTAPVPPGATACPAEAGYDRLVAAVERWSPFCAVNAPAYADQPAEVRRRVDSCDLQSLGGQRGDAYGTGSILDYGCTISDVLRPKFP